MVNRIKKTNQKFLNQAQRSQVKMVSPISPPLHSIFVVSYFVLGMLIGSTEAGCTFQRGYSPSSYGTLCSTGGRLMGRLDWQSDGNLVIYNDFNNVATWSTHSSGNPNSRLVFGADGNLAIYGGYNNLLFSSGTANRGVTLSFQDDSNLVIRDANGVAVWSSGITVTPPTGSKCVYRMGTAFATPGTLCSNWNCHLALQADWNLAIWQDSSSSALTPYWAPYRQGPARATFQTDGNFVMYNSANAPVWASQTMNTGHSLIFRDDCNLVIYSSSGAQVWASGSSIPQCDCDYHPGGCTISQPAPTGYKCSCNYWAWTCDGVPIVCPSGQVTGECGGTCTTKACCSGECGGYP